MKDICCIDCEYYCEDLLFDDEDNCEVRGYCEKGSVLVEVVPNLEHDCADFKQFIEDI